jgi:hypothetical protein
MGNVVIANIATRGPIPAEQVLETALAAGLDDVLVIGWTTAGRLYLAASTGQLGSHLILLERAKHTLLQQGDDP